MSHLEIHDQEGERRVPVSGYMTVGRAGQNNIVLQSLTASRQHARIMIQGNTPLLEDLGSTHGTRVNGRRLQGWQALHHHDRIEIGDAMLIYHEDGPVDQIPTPRDPAGATQALASCPGCGSPNSVGSVNCRHCGMPLQRSNAGAISSLNTGPVPFVSGLPVGGLAGSTMAPHQERMTLWLAVLMAIIFLLLCVLLLLVAIQVGGFGLGTLLSGAVSL